MKKEAVLFCALILLVSGSQAQFTRYIVRFKNKAATTFTFSNPSAYLSQRAIERRLRYNIAIDSTDLPVPAAYISQVQNIPNVIILNISRWLNAVSISTTDANAINIINALPFVQNTSAIGARYATGNRDEYIEETEPVFRSRAVQLNGDNFFNYGTTSLNEIHVHEGEFLHNIGLRGQGMQIALLDGGFYQYTNFKAFDSANANNQFLDTWDFVAGEQSVVEDNSHGMSCLSTIAANIPGQFIGTAPKAGFRLYRTEDASSEYPVEEFNWVCGVERADSAGSDVISSSLGYSDFDNAIFNHTYNDMNGDVIVSTIAADLAAKKGLLLFIAAGNDGNNPWRYILSPADADSVLAVGAVSVSGATGTFSSYGPSADGRIKPDIASVGVNAMVQTSSNTIGFSNGTSYACPKIAGLGTALWQGFPEYDNMRIVRAIQQAGSIYTTPDNRIGYGVPNMKTAFSSLLIDFSSLAATIIGCSAVITWGSKDVSAMKYEIERKTPGDINFIKVGETNPQAGNKLSSHTYQFTDILNNTSIGSTISYRIRQIIDTATASFTAVYLDTVSIATTMPCSENNIDKIFLAPNPPSGDYALLAVQTSYEISSMPITVFDMKGSLIMQLNRSKTSGRSFFSIPINTLPKGKYIIKVYSAQKAIGTTEFLKL